MPQGNLFIISTSSGKIWNAKGMKRVHGGSRYSVVGPVNQSYDVAGSTVDLGLCLSGKWADLGIPLEATAEV